MTINEAEFYEDEQQAESEDDLNNLDQQIFSSAVVSGNDWTTETIINQINKGNIKLNPSFQRRDAWDKKRKSRFIESLFLGLPIPQIVLAESKERRGAYLVLDGKQRLLSIRQFAAETDDPQYQQLKLSSLEIRKDLNRKTLSNLKNDLTFFDDLASFENQPIRTVVIKNWPSEDFLYHVFLRLNTGSVPLSPQELRQALHPGDFMDFLDEKSCESDALKDILNLKKPDFRMRDAELLLRYYAFKNNLNTYAGSLKAFLDGTCEELNTNWVEKQDEISQQLEAFELAHSRVKSIFGGNAYRKWTGVKYESRFNRSIFDVMVLSFSQEEVRESSLEKDGDIENAFKELCISDRDFLSSIETTTKSLTATHTRISKWNSALNAAIGTNIRVPELINNRIV